MKLVYTDKIVGRLGEFRELTKAVRDGDLATVSFLCEQLFQLNSDIEHPPQAHRHRRVEPYRPDGCASSMQFVRSFQSRPPPA